MYFVHPDILQVTKPGMVYKNNYCNGYLQLPFPVSDQYGTADKRKKVHLKQAVHLVDVLGHKNANDRRQHILV